MKFYEYLLEGRDEKLKYSEKKVKGVLDRVTVQLEGNPSGKYTKLARTFSRLKKANEKLIEKQNELNEKLKSEALSLFDAQDEIYTRVVETCALTITVSKKTVSTTKKVDYDAIIDGLIVLVPELEEQIKALIEANTTVKTTEKSPGLRVDLQEKPINEAFDFKSIKAFARSILNKIKSWSRGYDKKLNALKAKV